MREIVSDVLHVCILGHLFTQTLVSLSLRVYKWVGYDVGEIQDMDKHTKCEFN